MHWLQKSAMAFFVLSLSSLIFFILISDRQTRNSVLRPTLEALGEQLFAAVEDDVDKEQLRAGYREFIREAEEQQIDSARVEKVAAEILNLSRRDSLISSRDALRILEKAQMAVVIPAAPPATKQAQVRDPDRERHTWIAGRSLPPSWDKEEMAVRLKAMQEFQRQMDRIARESAQLKTLEERYRFQQTDSGLRVLMDSQVVETLAKRDTLMWRKLRELEKKQWLMWGPPPPPPHQGREDSLRAGRIFFHPQERDITRREP